MTERSAPVRVHDSNGLKWLSGADYADPTVIDQLSPEELSSLLATHEEGGDSNPQLFEVKLPAGTHIDIHAHVESEIIYILGGTMVLGNRSLTAGSSVFVRGGTLYGFRAGEDGLHMLNFRPRKDKSYISREEFLQRMRPAP